MKKKYFFISVRKEIKIATPEEALKELVKKFKYSGGDPDQVLFCYVGKADCFIIRGKDGRDLWKGIVSQDGRVEFHSV